MPIVLRFGVASAIVFGVCGGAVGLIVGFHVYARTAGIAMVELGFPATVLGFTMGCAAGAVAALISAARKRDSSPESTEPPVPGNP